MHHRWLPLVLACASAAAGLEAQAQEAAPQQTAAGAQRFLALLAQDQLLYVEIRFANGQVLPLQGTRTEAYRWLKDGVPQSDGPYPDRTEPVSAALKSMLSISAISSVDARGNADDCTTRIDTTSKEKPDQVTTDDSFVIEETFFSVNRRPYRRTQTLRYEDPAAKYAGPHYVAWGKAAIHRAQNGRVAARVNRGSAELVLVYAGDLRKDAEMTDRVEYAMKFLKASCDKTAATGF